MNHEVARIEGTWKEMLSRNCEVCNARGNYETIHQRCIVSHKDFRVSNTENLGVPTIPTFTAKYLCINCKEKLNGD